MTRIPGAVILRESEPLLRTLAAATAVGILLGAVIGGLGSRLAMRLLFLTSDPAMQGVLTDDGFPIGEITFAGTANLILSVTGFGVIGAFVYLAVRRFLIGPQWLRLLGCGLAAGVVVGAGLVHADGVDFTRLGPAWLAIALFVATPTLYGFVAPLAIEWADRPGGWFRTAPAPLALLPLVVFLFPPLFMLLIVPTLVVVVAGRVITRSPSLARFASHGATMWTARVGWLGIVSLGLFDLTRDALVLL